MHVCCVLSTVGTEGRLPSTIVPGTEDDEENSGMRRACSLSDLSVSPPNRLLHGPIQGIPLQLAYNHHLENSRFYINYFI